MDYANTTALLLVYVGSNDVHDPTNNKAFNSNPMFKHKNEIELIVTDNCLISQLRDCISKLDFEGMNELKLQINCHGGMSTNGKNVIFQRSGPEVEVQEVINALNDENCPRLKGIKRNLEFFFRPCVEHKNLVEEWKPMYSFPLSPQQTNKSLTDTVVVWSTLHYNPVARPVTRPSFIQSFCDVLKSEDAKADINIILRQVQVNVEKKGIPEGCSNNMEFTTFGVEKKFYFYPQELLKIIPEESKNIYKLNNTSPGYCLILCYTFEWHKEKQILGIMNDVDEVTKQFTKLNFEVNTLQNRKCSETEQEIEQAINNAERNNKAFVLIVMSHSHVSNNENFFETTTGPIPTRVIMEMFMGRLRGLPKLIIFSLCSRILENVERCPKIIPIASGKNKRYLLDGYAGKLPMELNVMVDSMVRELRNISKSFSQKRGFCIIVHHTLKFKQSESIGCGHDIKVLRNFFTKLNYNVELVEDDQKEMNSLHKIMQLRISPEIPAFILVIMVHTRKSIKSEHCVEKNDNGMMVQKYIEVMKYTSVGVSKLLLMNFCRGTSDNLGVSQYPAITDEKKSVASMQCDEEKNRHLGDSFLKLLIKYRPNSALTIDSYTLDTLQNTLLCWSTKDVFGHKTDPISVLNFPDTLFIVNPTTNAAVFDHFNEENGSLLKPTTATETDSIVADGNKIFSSLLRDTLIFWSAIEGCETESDPVNGSYFSNAFLNCMRKAQDMDILQVLRNVELKMNEERSFQKQLRRIKKFNECSEDLKQNVEINAIGLRKLLNFSVTSALQNKETMDTHYPLTFEPGIRTGTCLIINNYRFEEDLRATILGTHVDVRNYEEVFESLNFQVFIKENITRSEFLDYFNDDVVFNANLQKQSAFVLVFITHCIRKQNLDYLLFADNEMLNVDVLKHKLNDLSFTAMANKPKFVILQTSRKRPYDEYFELNKIVDRKLQLIFNDRVDFSVKIYIHKYVFQSKDTYDEEFVNICGECDEMTHNFEKFVEKYKSLCDKAKRVQENLTELKKNHSNVVSRRMLSKTHAEMKNALDLIRLQIEYYEHSKTYVDFQWNCYTA